MASQAPLEPVNASPQTAQPVHRTIGAKTGPQGPAIRRLAGAMNAGPRALQLKAAAEAIGKGRPAVLPNRTGLPGNLKRGIESLSGMSLDQVRVRYNSDRPERIDAEAYAQGSEIHVAPGAERHLPHEAWHVVQQAQGRVQPTLQRKVRGLAGDVLLNDGAALESEADRMGARALGSGVTGPSQSWLRPTVASATVQRAGGAAEKKRKAKERAEAYQDKQERKQSVRTLGRETAEKKAILTAQPHMDPANRSDEDASTRGMALKQTMAARNLLENPGQTVRDEMGAASSTLHGIFKGLDRKDQKSLGGRLFGSEGMLPGKKPKHLQKVLARVGGNAPGTTAKDRAITMALMGDIGALYADTGATTGVEGRTPKDEAKLRESLSKGLLAKGLTPTNPDIVKQVQLVGGSSAVGPRKKIERSRPKGPKPPRSGIHNLGGEADDKLGIPPGRRLPPSRWDVAHIDPWRVGDTTEPLAGHMSGSPAEILQVFDMLRGTPGKDQYVGALNSQKANPHAMPMADMTPAQQRGRSARAAAADAFLVGGGYHSAVEVAEGTLAYTGQNLRGAVGKQEDAGHLLGHGAATDLISELMDDHSATADPLRVGSKKQIQARNKRVEKAISYKDRQENKR
jgi:hypothetical protein